MSTKTVTLSLPAYERLRRARRRPAESFSQVVLRAKRSEETVMGGELLRTVKDQRVRYGRTELARVDDAKRAGQPPEDKRRTDYSQPHMFRG